MIEVWAGPDDFAFERDRELWRLWIKQNVTTTPYFVDAHNTDAYKAVITFADDHWDIIFRLKAPEYISEALVECNESWILGKLGHERFCKRVSRDNRATA